MTGWPGLATLALGAVVSAIAFFVAVEVTRWQELSPATTVFLWLIFGTLGIIVVAVIAQYMDNEKTKRDEVLEAQRRREILEAAMDEKRREKDGRD